MPELPEVETVRHDLEREYAGHKVKAVTVTGARSVRRTGTVKLDEGLPGRTIKAVRRRGKYLIAELDDGSWLVVHLRMSGQLLKAQPKDKVPPHTHVRITFTQGPELRFVDPRTFGEMFLTHPDRLAAEAPDLAELGFDAYTSPGTWMDLGRILRKTSTPLKTLITDQKVIAGIGNIYADEIRRLFRSMLEVLHDAVAHRGSSLADEQYVDLAGRLGTYQTLHQVYARDGKACQRCRAVIEKVKFAGRSTYYCPQCQV